MAEHRGLKFEHLMVLVGIVVGVAMGSSRIGDNSTLVHLTTGLGILNTGHIPRTDPYSFTAHGQPWVVQSWLPEILYGAVYKLGGSHLFQLLNMVVYGFIGGLVAQMARTGNWVRTAVVGFVGIGLGVAAWAPRPTEFGFLFFLLLVWLVSRKRNPAWLVPLAFLWVNSHGSWPLGIAYLATVVIGTRIDRGSVKPFLRYLGTFAVASVIAAFLSPGHWRALTFPLLPFGDRAHAFDNIIEWMAPDFRNPQFISGPLILMALVVMCAVLFRRPTRWADLLPTGLLLALSLAGSRNFPLLGMAVVPVLAAALKAEPVYSPPPGKRFYISAMAGPPGWGIAVLVALCGLGAVGDAYYRPGFDLAGYPQAGYQHLVAQQLIGGDRRVYAPDYVGCYFIFEQGRNANIFLDDRYDMYPASVSDDAAALSGLSADVEPLVNKYRFDAMVVPRGSKLSVYLAVDSRWDMSWSDKNWEIFEPRTIAVSTLS